jgi:hypothetical protein
MNTMLQVQSVAHIDDNELRQITLAEQIQANGGLACYKQPTGYPNKYRWVAANGGTRAVDQEWNGKRYVLTGSSFPTGGAGAIAFINFCARIGYNYIQ